MLTEMAKPVSREDVLGLIESPGFAGRLNATLGVGILPVRDVENLAALVRRHQALPEAVQAIYESVLTRPEQRSWLVAIGYAAAVVNK